MTYFYIMIGLLGLIVGSFLNVVIYRLPRMMQTDTPSINLWLPRSHCPHCATPIPFWHNIPLISYCILHGRCHACQASIAYRYPLVEGLSLILSLLVAIGFGMQWSLLFALLFVWIIICLTFIDLEYQLLPDCLTLGLLWLGLLANTNALFAPLTEAVWSAACAYLSLWILIQVFYLITRKIGMGHGDFKLFAALGAFFGAKALLPILLIASISGTVCGVLYLTIHHKSKDTPIPFGPFLCLGGLSVLVATMLK